VIERDRCSNFKGKKKKKQNARNPKARFQSTTQFANKNEAAKQTDKKLLDFVLESHMNI
jgi:hypothetical protein